VRIHAAIYVQEILTDAGIAIRISNSSRESRSLSPDGEEEDSRRKSAKIRKRTEGGALREVAFRFSKSGDCRAYYLLRKSRKRNLAASFLASVDKQIRGNRVKKHASRNFFVRTDINLVTDSISRLPENGQGGFSLCHVTR
jgi:hypothetical protein